MSRFWSRIDHAGGAGDAGDAGGAGRSTDWVPLEAGEEKVFFPLIRLNYCYFAKNGSLRRWGHETTDRLLTFYP